MPVKPIEAVLEEYTETLMSVPEVIGTSQGVWGGSPCIKVYVILKSPALSRDIPRELEGYPVKIEVTGPICAF